MKDAIVDGYVMCDDGRSSVLMDYRMEDISYGTRRRYADIMIDRGFKIVFGSPANKDLLISLLECLIPECRIADIRFLDKEVPGFTMQDKKTIFDLNCRAPDGKTFVVEMQLGQQTYFCDRALFYSTYPIREQLLSSGEGRAGGPARGYRLNPVYVVSIVNFSLPHESASVLREGLVSSYSLRSDRGNELMTDALHFVYFELARLPYGREEWHRCRTLLEKLAFAFRYISCLEDRPLEFSEGLFQRLFTAAELAGMSPAERKIYDKDMTTALDIIAQRDFAREEGLKEGRQEGLAEGLNKGREVGRSERDRELARRMLDLGYSAEAVITVTGLSREDVETLHRSGVGWDESGGTEKI